MEVYRLLIVPAKPVCGIVGAKIIWSRICKQDAGIDVLYRSESCMAKVMFVNQLPNCINNRNEKPFGMSDVKVKTVPTMSNTETVNKSKKLLIVL